MSAMQLKRDEIPIECQHSNMKYLGDNRDARFLRCEACAQVFVLHGGQVWAIPALRRAEQTDETQDYEQPHLTP